MQTEGIICQRNVFEFAQKLLDPKVKFNYQIENTSPSLHLCDYDSSLTCVIYGSIHIEFKSEIIIFTSN